MLVIACLDEFVFGTREAAWPLIRASLGLHYAQVGLILTLPNIVSGVLEPVLGVLGDTARRSVVIGGGVVYAVGLALIAGSNGFLAILLGTALLYPASGAFVSLSQATLMDLAPLRRERNMARWNFAGSVGALAGPFALSGVVLLGLGWRPMFMALAVISVAVVALSARTMPHPRPETARPDFRTGVRAVLEALRRREVLRSLALLDISDLLLDVLLGYLALYFVDVAGASLAQAALVVAVWTGGSLVGGLAIIPLLERLPALRYVRISAAMALIVFPTFLLIPGLAPKIILLALLSLGIAGWYPVLQARLYDTMPEQSGAVMSVSAVFSLVSAPLPFVIGQAAQHFGLAPAMWLLIIAPVALLVGLPRE